jgi:hypothetical protein
MPQRRDLRCDVTTLGVSAALEVAEGRLLKG